MVKVDDFSVDAEALVRRHMDWCIPTSYCKACSCQGVTAKFCDWIKGWFKSYWVKSNKKVLLDSVFCREKYIKAKETYQYRNMKGKLYKTNAAIWYNKIHREKR